MLWNPKTAIQILTIFFCHWSRKISSLKISLDRLNNSTYHWVCACLSWQHSILPLFWLDRKGYMLPFCVILCVHMCGVHHVCGVWHRYIYILFLFIYLSWQGTLFTFFFNTINNYFFKNIIFFQSFIYFFSVQLGDCIAPTCTFQL